MTKNLKIPFDANLEILKYVENDPKEEGRWIVEGWISTEDVDFQGDQISGEAFESAVKDLLASPTVLYNHDADKEIGRVLDAKVNETDDGKKGLWVKVLISSTVPKIWKKIKEGVLNKFSIRGKILQAKAKLEEETQEIIRYITKIKLLECSIVSVAANPEAKALAWYVEKALNDFVENGGELDFVENDGELDLEDVEVNEDFSVESKKMDNKESEGGENQMQTEELEKTLGLLRDFVKELSQSNFAPVPGSTGEGAEGAETSKASIEDLKEQLGEIVTLADNSIPNATEDVKKALEDIRTIAESTMDMLTSMEVPHAEGEMAASADLESLKQEVDDIKKAQQTLRESIEAVQKSLTELTKSLAADGSEGSEEVEKGDSEKVEKIDSGKEEEKEIQKDFSTTPDPALEDLRKSVSEMQAAVKTLTKTIREDLPIRKGFSAQTEVTSEEKKKFEELEKLPPDQRLRKLLDIIPEVAGSNGSS